jgi:hypothetical protein
MNDEELIAALDCVDEITIEPILELIGELQSYMADATSALKDLDSLANGLTNDILDAVRAHREVNHE